MPSVLLPWDLPIANSCQNSETTKTEIAASSFFDAMKRVFYGEKIIIPHVFLPLMEYSFATLSAAGLLIAISISLAGFTKLSFVIVLFSGATFFASSITAQAILQEGLTKNVHKFHEQNTRLEKEVDRLSLTNDQLSKTAASLEKTNQDLKKTNEDLQHTNERLTEQVDRFAEENHKFAEQVSLFTHQNRLLAEQLSTLQGQLQEFSAQNAELRSSIFSLKKETNRLSEQNTRTEALFARQEQEMNLLIQKNQTLMDQNLLLVETVKNQMTESQAAFQQLFLSTREEGSRLISNLSSHLTAILDTPQFSQRLQELRSVTQSIREAASELERVKEQQIKETLKLQECELRIQHHVEQLQKHEATLASYEEQITERQTLLNELQTAFTTLLREHKQENERQTSLNDLLTQLLFLLQRPS